MVHLLDTLYTWIRGARAPCPGTVACVSMEANCTHTQDRKQPARTARASSRFHRRDASRPCIGPTRPILDASASKWSNPVSVTKVTVLRVLVLSFPAQLGQCRLCWVIHRCVAGTVEAGGAQQPSQRPQPQLTTVPRAQALPQVAPQLL